MPITKSAKKALRQNITRKKRNVQRKDKVKRLIKEAKKLVAQKKFDEAKNILPRVYKALDKTAKIGVIKKNTASRKKSRLTKFINKGQISATSKSSAK